MCPLAPSCSWWVVFAEYACRFARLTLSTAPTSLCSSYVSVLGGALSCGLSFTHLPVLLQMRDLRAHTCVPSPGSTVALGYPARVYFLTHLSPSLSSCPTRPAARRSTLDALNPTLSPTLNVTRHQGEALRSHSSSPILQAYCIVLLRHTHRPAAGAKRLGERRSAWRVSSRPPG